MRWFVFIEAQLAVVVRYIGPQRPLMLGAEMAAARR